MIHFQIEPVFQDLFNQKTLAVLARAAISGSGLDAEGELTIVINDQEFIHNLNLRYRGFDSSTDVLSFPAGDIDPDTGKTYHGDVVISFPDAYQNAKIAGHSVDTELALLLVHGILHLAGYDHGGPEEQAEMWEIQDKILKTNGIRVSNP